MITYDLLILIDILAMTAWVWLQKVETSPSLEPDDGEEATSSSSPRTVSSIQVRQDEDAEEEDENEEEEEEEESEEEESANEVQVFLWY